jgi:hypothetical protein
MFCLLYIFFLTYRVMRNILRRCKDSWEGGGGVQELGTTIQKQNEGIRPCRDRDKIFDRRKGQRKYCDIVPLNPSTYDRDDGWMIEAAQ